MTPIDEAKCVIDKIKALDSVIDASKRTFAPDNFRDTREPLKDIQERLKFPYYGDRGFY